LSEVESINPINDWTNRVSVEATFLRLKPTEVGGEKKDQNQPVIYNIE